LVNDSNAADWLTPAVQRLIALALDEDLGRGDVTSEAIFGDDETPRAGVIVAKEPLLLCGGPIVEAVFRAVDARVHVALLHPEGTRLQPKHRAIELEGPVRSILAAERTALNFLQRLSGIATRTRRYVDAIAGTRARIVDTRKTLPGWRHLDKRAVLVGGARNHRADLGSGVLIKDNHVAAAGSVKRAVERAQERAPHGLRVEVEVTTLQQLDEALAAEAEIVLLDNMTPEQVKEAVDRIAGRALVEVSGGVTLDTVRAYAEAGPDLISIGALTHSAPAVDLSLEL
jgi:nicotinate-nucleotide pyrophosphorylase (carboxylating)